MAALMRFTITVPAQIIQVFLGIVKIILMNHGSAVNSAVIHWIESDHQHSDKEQKLHFPNCARKNIPGPCKACREQMIQPVIQRAIFRLLIANGASCRDTQKR